MILRKKTRSQASMPAFLLCMLFATTHLCGTTTAFLLPSSAKTTTPPPRLVVAPPKANPPNPPDTSLAALPEAVAAVAGLEDVGKEVLPQVLPVLEDTGLKAAINQLGEETGPKAAVDLLFLAIGVGGVGILAKNAVTVVRQGDTSIVERFGRFRARLDPGLHFLIPFVDTIRVTLTNREQVLDIPPQNCITSDNAPIQADAVVYWKIVDAERAIYAVENLGGAIQNLVLTQLRAEIGKLTLDETFSARERINRVLLDELDIATDPWGVRIVRVEVQEIIPNKDILLAMEQQLAAERTKRASIIKSEGERERSVNEAEGAARSRIIEAEADARSLVVKAEARAEQTEKEARGVALALEAIADALGDGNSKSDARANAARFQLMREYIGAQQALATSPNAKVVVTGGNSGVDDLFAKAVAFYDAAEDFYDPEEDDDDAVKEK